MKKLIALSMVAVMAISVALAKPPVKSTSTAKAKVVQQPKVDQKGPQGRGRFREELYKKLKLTDAQKKKVEAINQKYRKQFEAMRGQKPDPKGFEKMKGLMDKRNKEIMAVLDKNQKKIYEAEMKKWQQMRGPGGPGGHGGPGGPGGPGGMGRPGGPAGGRK